jgi:hypothetical protein
MVDEVSIRSYLNWELQDCLLENEEGFELDHPLLRELNVRADRVAHLNEMYEAKLRNCEQAFREGDWAGYVELHERPHRIAAFIEIMHELNDQSYWELLAHFWIDCENIWQNYNDWRDLWNSDRSQKHFAMTAEERQEFVTLPDEVTIYRGVEKAEYDVGFSWSLSREKAIWFGQRRCSVGGDYYLITGKAKKHDVHALLHRRGEQEVVVDKFLIVSRERQRNSVNDQN